jgi:energy-coupling factor transporter ATP-binding protein EcfA2
VLLTGSKGVGKTTLMKGLAAIINRYSGRVLAVYRNFEEVDNVRGPSHDLGFDGAFRTETYDKWCLQHRRCLIFFGDEFDTLYTRESMRQESSVRIASEILSLGKSTLGLGIISGSSACLTSLAFKEGPNKYSDFPNMNCTVFVHHRWPPVREQESSGGYIEIERKGFTD